MKTLTACREAIAFVEVILQDHAELHDLLEQLKTAVANDHNGHAREVLLRFQVWEERHFAAEEAAMRSFDFPDYEAHRRHHNVLRDALAAIGSYLLLEEPRALHLSVVDYVEQTLAHLEELDGPLESYLRACTAQA